MYQKSNPFPKFRPTSIPFLIFLSIQLLIIWQVCRYGSLCKFCRFLDFFWYQIKSSSLKPYQNVNSKQTTFCANWFVLCFNQFLTIMQQICNCWWKSRKVLGRSKSHCDFSKNSVQMIVLFQLLVKKCTQMFGLSGSTILKVIHLTILFF